MLVTYVGHSHCHTSVIVLVLNPTTDQVSSQFLVVFGYAFSTVLNICLGIVAEHLKIWYRIQ
jgi:hypothetical protein